jgi:hypothetical protein
MRIRSPSWHLSINNFAMPYGIKSMSFDEAICDYSDGTS